MYSNHDDSEEVSCGHSGFPSDECEWVEAGADDIDPSPPEAEAGFSMMQQSLHRACLMFPCSLDLLCGSICCVRQWRLLSQMV